jgi:hypothetical protein
MKQMKRIILSIAAGALALLGAEAASAQEAQPVHKYTEEQMAPEWYAAQVTAWKRVVEKTPTDADAWLNYFRAVRYSGFGDTSTSWEEKTRRQMDAAGEIGRALPDSWIYHYTTYWAGGNDLSLYPHLERALELHPDYALLSSDLVTYNEVTGHPDKMELYCRKWYESRSLSPGLLDYNYNVLMSLDSNAVLVTVGDNDTYPIWILQNARGIRPDVTVLNTSLILIPEYRARLMKEKNIRADETLLSDEHLGKVSVETGQAEFFASLARSTKRPVYFALTADTGLTSLIRDDLYTVGLANRYSPHRIDNLAILERNWRAFRLNYLDFDIYDESYTFNHHLLPMLNMNYVTPAMLLYEHYRIAGKGDDAARMEKLIRSVAERGGQAREVEDYLRSVEAETPAGVETRQSTTSAASGRLALETKVFPNPSYNVLTVQLPDELDATFDLATTDGRVIRSTTGHGRTTTIDIADVPAGAYVLRIRTEQGEISRSIQVAR